MWNTMWSSINRYQKRHNFPCQKSARSFRAPDDVFMSNRHRSRNNMQFKKYIVNYIHTFLISRMVTIDINTKVLFTLEELRMLKMQRTSVIAVATVLSKCECHRNQRSVQIKPGSKYVLVFCFVLFDNLFLWKHDVEKYS